MKKISVELMQKNCPKCDSKMITGNRHYDVYTFTCDNCMTTTVRKDVEGLSIERQYKLVGDFPTEPEPEPDPDSQGHLETDIKRLFDYSLMQKDIEVKQTDAYCDIPY